MAVVMDAWKAEKWIQKKKEQCNPKIDTTPSPLSPAVRTRLELATPGVTGRHSNQLNYRTKFLVIIREKLSGN